MKRNSATIDSKSGNQISPKAAYQISRSLGVQSESLAQMLMEHLYKAGITFGPDDDPELLAKGINALVDELAPCNALEATLTTQLCASHILSMKELAAAAKARQDESKVLHYNLANKLQRTFLSQVEALTKLRGTRQLRMSVEQVSRDADGTQTRTQLYHEQKELNR